MSSPRQIVLNSTRRQMVSSTFSRNAHIRPASCTATRATSYPRTRSRPTGDSLQAATSLSSDRPRLRPRAFPLLFLPRPVLRLQSVGESGSGSCTTTGYSSRCHMAGGVYARWRSGSKRARLGLRHSLKERWALKTAARREVQEPCSCECGEALPRAELHRW